MKRSIAQLCLTLGLSIGAVLMALLLVTFPARAADQCVAPGGAGSCLATIQTAIDTAGSGDTVRVVAGAYTENLVIDKNITLLGGFDDTSLTSRTPRSSVINGGGNDSVIKISNSAVVTIDGFTISGGDATTNSGQGGGIDIRQGTATIRDNLIKDNVASSNPAIFGVGGGIHVLSSTSSVLISGNTIQANLAYSVVLTSPSVAQGGFGGGIEIDDASAATINDNQILSNVGGRTDVPGAAYGGGGGIAGFGNNTSLTIDGNTIQNNTGNAVGGDGWGGGINLYRVAVATVTNNSVMKNTAAISGTNAGGGGITVGEVQALTLTGNQVTSNTAMLTSAGQNISGGGGGVRIDGFNLPNDTATVENNRINDNVVAVTMTTSGTGSQGHAEGGGLLIRNISTTLVLSNEVRGNTAVENLSLSGSGGWGGRPSGGGMYLGDIDVLTVKDNEVRDNVTAKQQVVNGVDSNSEGGGITLANTQNASVRDNTISGNVTVMTGSITGNTGENYFPNSGGILASCWDRPNCSLSFVENDILNNTTAFSITISGSNAEGGANGGGMSIQRITALLQSNVISGNTANLNGDGASGGSGGGGGLDVNESAVVMSQNRILGNRTTQSGAGAPATWVWRGTLTSTNDVFARNFGGIGGGDGGGTISTITLINATLYDNGGAGGVINDSSRLYVTNTIVAGHNDGLRKNNASATLNGDYNLLNNTNNNYVGITGGPNDLFNQDPLFVNAAVDDFHLSSGSPAIDKGNDAVAPAVDFEDNARPIDGNSDGVARSDIGADEFGQALYLPTILKNS